MARRTAKLPEQAKSTIGNLSSNWASCISRHVTHSRSLSFMHDLSESSLMHL